MIGRTIFSLLPQWIGRRRCGEIMGYGIAASLGAAGLFFDQTLFGYSRWRSRNPLKTREQAPNLGREGETVAARPTPS